ncbi:MAG: lysoplasmalogenase [Actinomycetota bacterium]
MTGGALLLLALALVVAAGDWHAVYHGNRLLEYLCKPLTMVVLFAATLALDVDDGGMRGWFLLAILLSLTGDVFLMIPRNLFVFGLASFLLGHLAYIVGMHVGGVDAARLLVGAALVAVALAIIGSRVLRGVRAGSEPELAGPVLAYMLVISAMVASAFGTGSGAAVLGASSFYASDALIAWNRFISETRHARLTIMVTYHLAQMGLVVSLI